MNQLNIKYFFTVVGLIVAIVSCETTDYGVDITELTDPVIEGVLGTDTAVAGSTETFTVEAFREDSEFAWVVSGANAVSNSGSSIDLTFDVVGATSATVSVTETNVTGQVGQPLEITVPIKLMEPAVVGDSLLTKIITDKDGATIDNIPFKDGDSDSVVIIFDKPLKVLPTLTATAGGGAFTTPTFYKGSKTTVISQYTAASGGGNGAAIFQITNAVAEDSHGGLTMDTTDVDDLIAIDNAAPIGAFTYNEEAVLYVQDSVPVVVTLTFNEVIALESIPFTASGPGIPNVTDKLVGSTDEKEAGKVFEYVYTPPAAGVTVVTFTVDETETPDLAGNEAAPVIGGDKLTIDTESPVLSFTSATDAGSGKVDLAAQSSEDGEVRYLILASGADAPEASDLAVSFSTVGGFIAEERLEFVEIGNYDVYFMAVDRAGNASVISAPVPLTVN